MSELQLREFWYENERIRRREFRRNGKLEGECTEWYWDGSLYSKSIYKAGKIEGKYESWFVDGNLHCEEFYKNGKREGRRRLWDGSRQPSAQDFYRNGKREGESKWWGPDGCLEGDFYSRNDVVIIDNNLFTWKRKHNILCIKYLSRRRLFRDINSFLISDLETTV
jgi:hypothetical protein